MLDLESCPKKLLSSISTIFVAALCDVPVHHFVQSKVHCFIGVCPRRHDRRGCRTVIWLHATPEVSKPCVSTGAFRGFREHDLYGAEWVVRQCVSTHLLSLQVRKRQQFPSLLPSCYLMSNCALDTMLDTYCANEKIRQQQHDEV